ncbi:MAG: hypothetical protein IKV94_05635 [Clostridia bacterium]|nr:hypothetical protein [Clostridia bacterium]
MKYLIDTKYNPIWNDTILLRVFNEDELNKEIVISKRKLLDKISRLKEITEEYIILLKHINSLFSIEFDVLTNNLILCINPDAYDLIPQTLIHFVVERNDFIKTLLECKDNSNEVSMIIIIKRGNETIRIVAKPMKRPLVMEYEKRNILLVYELVDYYRNEAGKIIGLMPKIENGNHFIYQLNGSREEISILKISY